MSKAPAIRWPMRYLPVPVSAGVFPMIVPGCNQAYSHPTIALHLHEYAGDIWIGKNRFRLRPGDITLSSAITASRYALPDGGSHLCLHFLPAERAARAGCVELPLHFRLGPQTAAARERFWRVIDHARQAGPRAGSVAGCAASASLQELLLWLHLQTRRGALPRYGSLAEEALAKLAAAIDSSLGHPMLVGELAANAGLSAEYVARLFAKRHGMTLQRYLLLRRIELARHLLVSSDLLVSEIGQRVGIPDPQYFNKQFRRIAGQSPLAYRRLRAVRKGRPARTKANAKAAAALASRSARGAP